MPSGCFTGLIIGSGTALVRGGPLGILLGWSFVGLVCYLVMVALGEMAAYLPIKSGFAGYATRFVDPAFGFAVGWNYLVCLKHLTLFSIQRNMIALPFIS